jgi:Cyclic nucleotide-binding domain/Major Facilitator Superfamily
VLGEAPRVLRQVFRNGELRRVELAFAVFNSAEWAVWIAMLVYAYDHGGATTAGLVAFGQLVPACLLAPWTSSLADRHPPARVLAGGYVVQAAAMGATAATLLAGGPSLLAYALAAAGATAVTVTRPTQAALLPGLARSPEELTATNVVSGWIESLAMLASPALTGLLLGVGSPGTVFAVMAALTLAATALVARLDGPRTPARDADSASTALAVIAREPAARLLVGVLASQYVLIGALDVLFVVLAIGVLDLGGSGAGYLNAAFGAGGVLGIAATVTLVGRRRLAPPLAAGAAVFSGAFLVIGLWPTVGGTVALLVAAGAGRTLLDVAGRTLLQRASPPDAIAGVFGVLEAGSMAGLALGSLLVPALIALGGARAASIGLGALLPAVALVAGRRLLAVDSSATVPVVQLSLLRSLALFAPLGAPVLEPLARELTPVGVSAGNAIIREGDPGDLFYVVASGALEVWSGGERLRVLGRGDGFGELALLLDVPRTADVVATTDAHLYTLGKGAFVTSVTGHPSSAAEAARLIRERVPAE